MQRAYLVRSHILLQRVINKRKYSMKQFNTEQPQTILVIPDSHAAPNESLERFTWLGKLIVDKRPDVVLDIGDRADMPSLSTYDKGTKGFEGRRYQNDIKSVIEANKRLMKPLRKLQAKQRHDKKKIYKPKLIITLGNHEQRIERAVNAEPILEGVLSYDDLGYAKDGWDVIPFLEPVEVQGILFSHYFVSGVMSRPIGGVNSARSQAVKTHRSCVSGHSHLFDYAEEADAAGKCIQSLVCGCFVENNAPWNTDQAYSKWKSCVVILHRAVDGNYDMEVISIERLKEMYK